MTSIPPLSPSAQPRWRLPRTAHTPHPAAVLVSFVVAAFAIGLSQQGAAAVIQDQRQFYDVSVDVIGYTIVAYALGVVLGAPLIMVGLAAWNRRALLLTMSGAFVATSLLTLVAPTVPVLFVARFLNGLPHGALLGTASYVGMLALGRERRGRAIATIMYGLSLAAVAGVPAMQWLSDTAGWKASYGAVTIVGVIGLMLMWAFVPSVPGAPGAGLRVEMAALTGRVLWVTIVAVAFGFAGFGAVQSYLVPLLEDANGFSGGVVTVVLMLFGVGLTAGAYLGGRLSDRSVLLTTRIGVISVAGVLLALGLFATSGWPVIVLVVLMGTAVQIFSQGVQAHLMDVVHTSPSLGAALSHSALNAAQVLGAGLGAVVIGLGWGLAAPAWMALVLALVAIVLVYRGAGFRSEG